MGEDESVAAAWHQIGMVHQATGNGAAAETAYCRSLALKVQLGNIAGQASTLNELGNLYANVLDRPEDAVTHYRQATERFVASQDVVGEGKAHSNLSNTLRCLGHYAEARREIERALECMKGLGHEVQPWKSWAILADIERDEGRVDAARHAHAQACTAYLAYRRDGGENHDPDARLAAEIGRQLAAGDAVGAAALLRELAGKPNPPDLRPPFVGVLQAIIAGQRAPVLADAPGLSYSSAAEILLLLDGLRAAGR
ncbi:MAG: tetratricopeptide repeat protein [Xanthomonadales bacterium]|jgi:tetratricopeptide (TPR) repeat protein|nr:tetratricopeptide repeat protein [Xanthomonadales bacterium]